MSVPKNIIRETLGLNEWNILHGYRGSIAHGMYIPPKDPLSIDDKDTIAVCVPTKEYYLGLRQYGSRGTKEIKRDVWDIVIFEAKKAISLLSKGNPNILAILWLEEKHYINKTNAGQLLIDCRHLFVGKHAYKSFVGYAVSQLRKMEQFERQGHMGAKRKELIQKFGYDTKNAAHLIRLLRMGIEFLSTGELYVTRYDAPQLLAIKRGEWTLERIKKEAERLFASAEQAFIGSLLPSFPDKNQINQLCVNVIQTAWNERNEI